jgi:threonylcarbamoyladenosine tRNA methylthiotransferase MtaB
MPQVNGNVIKSRAKILRSAVENQARAWHQDIVGSRQIVLSETGGKSGYAENFARVTFEKPMPEGKLIPVEIIASSYPELVGKPLEGLEA